MGKKVLLSLGGDTLYPGTLSQEAAKWLADFLWYSFGPYNAKVLASDLYPRPFHDAVVDGFDFDIEHDSGYGNRTRPCLLLHKYKLR